MNILGICSSPHANGNTAYSLRYALEIISAKGIETNYISLFDKKIAPCSGCFKCSNEKCIYNDDMDYICGALSKCDGLILASPVYMGLINGLMKNMMDRTVKLRATGKFQLSGKVGAGIACGYFRNGGQELTLQCMHTYFLQQDMFAIADGPPYCHSGAAIAEQAQTDTIGLKTVENISLRMIKAVTEKHL